MKKIQSIHFSRLPPTQVWLKENLDGLDPAIITRVTASCQTHGIGRRGHHWLSPDVGNLYTSWAIADLKNISSGLICQLLALAIVQFLKNTYHLLTRIKWPNDLYYSDKKIGGSLLK